MAAYKYQINYTGSSKLLKRIVDRLNHLSETMLGTEHDQAYYGDQGEAAYQHSLTTGNPHQLTLDDLGIAFTMRQIESLLADFGSIAVWSEHGNAAAGQPDAVMGDHEGAAIIFQTQQTQFLAWH